MKSISIAARRCCLLLLSFNLVIGHQLMLQAQTDLSNPLEAADPEKPDTLYKSAIIATALNGVNNRGLGVGYQRVDKVFIGTISAFILDVGYDPHARTGKPVRAHVLNMGYDINIGGRLNSWFGLFGGLGLFFPIHRYSGQTNVIPENESYSSSLNAGLQFYPWRFIVGGGVTYYLPYVYGPEFSDSDRENFKEIWNFNIHIGWRF